MTQLTGIWKGDNVGLSIEFWLQVGVQIVALSFFAGIVWTKLNYIEEKQDKHNDLIGRMYIVEESAKSAHRRLDEVSSKLDERE
jgi:hypothetical protein